MVDIARLDDAELQCLLLRFRSSMSNLPYRPRAPHELTRRTDIVIANAALNVVLLPRCNMSYRKTATFSIYRVWHLQYRSHHTSRSDGPSIASAREVGPSATPVTCQPSLGRQWWLTGGIGRWRGKDGTDWPPWRPVGSGRLDRRAVGSSRVARSFQSIPAAACRFVCRRPTELTVWSVLGGRRKTGRRNHLHHGPEWSRSVESGQRLRPFALYRTTVRAVAMIMLLLLLLLMMMMMMMSTMIMIMYFMLK